MRTIGHTRHRLCRSSAHLSQLGSRQIEVTARTAAALESRRCHHLVATESVVALEQGGGNRCSERLETLDDRRSLALDDLHRSLECLLSSPLPITKARTVPGVLVDAIDEIDLFLHCLQACVIEFTPGCVDRCDLGLQCLCFAWRDHGPELCRQPGSGGIEFGGPSLGVVDDGLELVDSSSDVSMTLLDLRDGPTSRLDLVALGEVVAPVPELFHERLGGLEIEQWVGVDAHR